MIITKKALPRRTFLRGMGATLALPVLDAMVPSMTAIARTGAAPVRRLGFIYMPMGCDITRWTPGSTDGTLKVLSPTLQSLEDEGLVKAEERDGRRVFQLTDDGRAHVTERRAAIGEPWKEVAGDADRRFFELRDLAGQVAAAVRQVARAGNAAQVEQTKKLLTDTRRNLYRLLAEDDSGTAGG